MTDGSGTPYPAAVRDRLPDGWCIEADGDNAVHGHAERSAATDPPRTPASFSIQKRDDELWVAAWKTAREAGDGPEEHPDRICATKERCVEWVAERAAEWEARKNG